MDSISKAYKNMQLTEEKTVDDILGQHVSGVRKFMNKFMSDDAKKKKFQEYIDIASDYIKNDPAGQKGIHPYSPSNRPDVYDMDPDYYLEKHSRTLASHMMRQDGHTDY